jgi:hypothetical protein
MKKKGSWRSVLHNCPRLVVGLDIGFGNTKVVWPGGAASFPSLVATAATMPLAGALLRRRRRRPLEVAIAGRHYWVGAEAAHWGHPIDATDLLRFRTEVTAVLAAAALGQIRRREPWMAAVVLGVPVQMLRAAEELREASQLLQRAVSDTGGVTVDGVPLGVSIEPLVAVAQPVGAWAAWALAADGKWAAPAARDALVGVVDVGLNTLDLAGLRGGAVEPAMMAGDELGVRYLVDLVWPHRAYPLAALALQEGRERAPVEAVEVWLAAVARFVRRAWRGAEPEIALLVGGGAHLLLAHTRRLERRLGCPVVVPADPVLAVATGLYRVGVRLWQRGAGEGGGVSRSTLS